MPSLYNRHGTARAGDDYQDLWGAQILVEFLEHPDRYQWVQFEADGFGALDDIVALRADGKYVIRQIKFTVDVENERYEVTWDWLLRHSGAQGHGTSLLKKWADSLAPHLASCVYEAALYTNRKAAADVTSVMNGDRIDFGAITDAAIRSEIITQLGGEDAARAFFREFRFRVDCPEPVTLEESLKSRFLAMHGDMLGWLNLMSEIRIWAKYKDRPAPSGEITIQVLRHAAAGTVSMSYHRGSSVLQITPCPLRTSIQLFWMPCATDAVHAWSSGGVQGLAKAHISAISSTL